MTKFVRITCLLLATFLAGFNFAHAETPEQWTEVANRELERALKLTPIVKQPKNVVFFLGDGMGIATLTAARIYKGQLQKQRGEEGSLVFEQFPHLGLSKTYNDNAQIPDSAGTATAYFCGVKADEGVLGVNSHAKLGNCSSAQGSSVTSILEWAQKAGKATGIVTTTRITHATPAGTYAHCPHRDWEAGVPAAKDSELPDDRSLCKDIARQLIEDEPGKSINVIFGGGRQAFWPANVEDPQSLRPVDSVTPKGARADSQNLINKWVDLKKLAGQSEKSTLVANVAELNNLKPSTTDNVLGLFAHNHLEFDAQRERNAPNQPTLAQMTTKAIELLINKKDGFFLMVEGGRIDHGHHDGVAKMALHDTVAFDAAIKAALDILPADDTLIVVTADHSHTLSIGGYPSRGANILMGDNYIALDELPYTTLTYANGLGAPVKKARAAYSGKTDADTFRQDAIIPLKTESHGGEDVAIYARGPFAHLFHTLHEQNYIPVAIDYAACYRSTVAAHCAKGTNKAADPPNGSTTLMRTSTFGGLSVIMMSVVSLLRSFI